MFKDNTYLDNHDRDRRSGGFDFFREISDLYAFFLFYYLKQIYLYYTGSKKIVSTLKS